MDHTITLIISGLISVGLVLMIAPRVLAANRGVALRNIAIWIGIFLLLALAYNTLGPGSKKTPPPENKERIDTSAPLSQAPSPSDMPAEAQDKKPSEADGFFTGN